MLQYYVCTNMAYFGSLRNRKNRNLLEQKELKDPDRLQLLAVHRNEAVIQVVPELMVGQTVRGDRRRLYKLKIPYNAYS